MNTGKKYTLRKTKEFYFNGREELMPRLNGFYVNDKELFYEVREQYVDKVLDKYWEFDYLLPQHIDDRDDVEFICDFHTWTVDHPTDIHSFPISKRLKEVLEKFNLYPNKFYNAKVLFKEKKYPYFVWQLFLNEFEKYIDFKHSTFKEWASSIEEISPEIIQTTSVDELYDIVDEKDWYTWGFEKAIMKPEFKEVDCMYFPNPLGIVISERLKNALEEVQPALTGFEIIECPVEFEYL